MNGLAHAAGEQPYRMVFTHPEMFVYLVLLVPAALLLFINYRRRFPLVAAFVQDMQRRDGGCAGRTALALRCFFSSFALLLFFACMITALAGPQMGSRLVREFRRGYDVIFAFDVSRSMVIRDCPPVGSGTTASSRLERSLWIARNLASASDSRLDEPLFIRFAVGFGKGESVLAVPLTPDIQAVRTVLDAISSESMTSRGTNLEHLVDTAAAGFLEHTPAGRQIILFSDGEGLSGSLSQAVERAWLRDITVCAVGVGSLAGALVAERDGDSTTMIRSFLHADALRSAVERRGGAYIDGNSGNAVNLLAEEILPLAGDSSWVFREEASEQWLFFVIAGLVFLCIAFALPFKSQGVWGM